MVVMASARDRGPTLDLIRRVAEKVFIPFCVGGGISTVADIRSTILAGAEKISINSPAVRNPLLIEEGAGIFGAQCIVLGMDAKRDPAMPSGYRVFINGGRVATDLDAVAWAAEAERLGAGEIVLNSIDADGTRDGYEIPITRMISERVSIPVVASGGAGTPAHMARVLTEGKADAALIASMVHSGDYTVKSIKEELAKLGVPVRL
ncbi:MAG TPA: HisA/HisF-related TIM barrel protein [Treponemataceae bacterium]|nr:HisA/HisF-related TIM barrel protein [Treponemataceae bacterium]